MIVPLEALPRLRKQHQSKTIVLGSGVFDLLHCGHVAYLQALRKHGDIVVVMVKSDERVRAGKGPTRPILPEADRATMVDALKGIDYVFVAPHIDFAGMVVDPVYQKVLTMLQPDVFYSTNSLWKQLEQVGGTKVILGDRPAHERLRSTTDIITHVLNKTKTAKH